MINIKRFSIDTNLEILDLLNTLYAQYEYFELSDLKEDEEPYPFHRWLEEVRQILADSDNPIWNYL